MAIDKNKLIKKIMADCEKDGEPVTEEEAKEMAEMEIKSNSVRRYESSGKRKSSSNRERKVDEEKKHLLDCVRILLQDMNADIVSITTETAIKFNYNDNDYTFKLVKHRVKKGE